MIQPEGHYLAQFNWASLRYDHNDPRVAEFINNVARINRLAERYPGFVWRHLNDRSELAKLKHPGIFKRAHRFTTTLSVWENLAALEGFAFKTIHKRFYEKRGEWFLNHEKPYAVFWWVPVGHQPSISEAVERADYMLKHGESEYAFGWGFARKLAEGEALSV